MTERSEAVSQDDLLALVDGQLDAARAAEVEGWLAGHPEEAALVADWRRQTALLKEALDPVLDEPVPAALSDALRRRRRLWTRVAATAAAAAIVAFPIGFATGRHAPPGVTGADPGQRLADQSLSAYHVYAAEVRHPVEVWANEEQHLVTWLTKRLGAPVKAPDLSHDGLHLVGGRLLAEDDKPQALLMYEDASGRRFTLLVERIVKGRPTAFRYVANSDAGAFYWIDGQIGYAITGPPDRIALLKVAETVYAQLDPGS